MKGFAIQGNGCFTSFRKETWLADNHAHPAPTTAAAFFYSISARRAPLTPEPKQSADCWQPANQTSRCCTARYSSANARRNHGGACLLSSSPELQPATPGPLTFTRGWSLGLREFHPLTPGSVSTTRGWNSCAPGLRRSRPGSAHATPRSKVVTPGLYRSSLGSSLATPGSNRSFQKLSCATLGFYRSTRGVNDTIPGSIGSTPGYLNGNVVLLSKNSVLRPGTQGLAGSGARRRSGKLRRR